MIFFLSFLALTCAPYNHSLLLKTPKVNVEEALTFSALMIFRNGQDEASVLLNQTTRFDIFSFIRDNPGFHFRALSDSLDMPIGVLQYHLGLLVDGGLLSTCQDGRYKRYFESKKFTEAEMKVISALRHETWRRILVVLLEKPSTTHKDLALELDVSSQALSWHMRRLEKVGIVDRETESLSVKYSLEATISAVVSQCVKLLN
jgi:predicted transcriptional regulator